MEEIDLQYYTYGLCSMFYAIMSWLFFVKREERLKAFVAFIMFFLLLQCLKDLGSIDKFYLDNKYWSMLMTSIDTTVVPVYGFILFELCRPGRLTWRSMILQELPFVVVLLLFAITGKETFYYIQISLSVIFGVFYACWVLIEVPKYHRWLKENFSYNKNINLHWLRAVMLSFFAILWIWLISGIFFYINITTVYMLSVLAIWPLICFFLYKHESVIDELHPIDEPQDEKPEELSEIGAKIHRLFVVDKIYLNPRLKLSDIAKMVGTNRTYLSQYFNREANSTFFDYVNNLRIEYARKLLIETDLTLENITEQSGFCSKSTFHRAFNTRYGCTPTNFRKHAQNQ